MSFPHPVTSSGENLHRQSSVGGSVTGEEPIHASTPASPSSGMSVNINTSNMNPSRFHRTIMNTSSLRRLKQKFSTGIMFGSIKGNNTETAIQAMQGLFETPSRGDLTEPDSNEAEEEVKICDCVVPCLCDVLGKELGGIQASYDSEGGRPKCLIEQGVPRVRGGNEDVFLIDFDDELKLDDGLPKVKEQNRPPLQVITSIVDSATPMAPPLEAGNLRSQSTYDAHLMDTRTLRQTVGNVQPTEPTSNALATNAEVIVPHREPTPNQIVKPTSAATAPTTPSTPPIGCNFFSRRPQVHELSTPVSSMSTNRTRSLTRGLAGTGNTTLSRAATQGGSNRRASAFMNGYVSFPPYQGVGVSGMANYTATLEDVGMWFGAVGRRLTTKIRSAGAVGAGLQNQSEDKKLGGTVAAEIRKLKRGTRAPSGSK